MRAERYIVGLAAESDTQRDYGLEIFRQYGADVYGSADFINYPKPHTGVEDNFVQSVVNRVNRGIGPYAVIGYTFNQAPLLNVRGLFSLFDTRISFEAADYRGVPTEVDIFRAAERTTLKAATRIGHLIGESVHPELLSEARVYEVKRRATLLITSPKDAASVQNNLA